MRNLIIAAIVAVAGLAFVSTSTPAAARGLASLPYTELGVYTSQPGESLDAFVLRIRPILVDYSKSTGFEACGVIAASADKTQYGVVLGSSGSRLGCVNYPSKVPAGMEYVGITYHSHGSDRPYRMNRADKILSGREDEDGPIRIGGDNLYGFSQQDYMSGAGFLATPKGVRFQDGVNTARDVVATMSVATAP
jgi:hypothetical protein